MATLYAVDASVFLNAFIEREACHAESRRLLTHLQEQAAPIVAPTLLLPEVAAALSRGSSDPPLARQFARALSRLPHLVLVPLDLALAKLATNIAAEHRLRGSDAVYTAVALRFGCALVTLDREQHDRVAAVLRTCYPAEACAELGL